MHPNPHLDLLVVEGHGQLGAVAGPAMGGNWRNSERRTGRHFVLQESGIPAMG